MKNWTRYIAVTVLMIGTGPLQGCWLMEQAVNQSAKNDVLPFDRAVWVANRGVRDDTNARRVMLDSAAALLKPGLTHAEVRELLGDPDNESEKRWAYVVGPRKLFKNEMDILVVVFAGGKITEFGKSSSG